MSKTVNIVILNISNNLLLFPQFHDCSCFWDTSKILIFSIWSTEGDEDDSLLLDLFKKINQCHVSKTVAESCKII